MLLVLGYLYIKWIFPLIVWFLGESEWLFLFLTKDFPRIYFDNVKQEALSYYISALTSLYIMDYDQTIKFIRDRAKNRDIKIIYAGTVYEWDQEDKDFISLTDEPLII